MLFGYLYYLRNVIRNPLPCSNLHCKFLIRLHGEYNILVKLCFFSTDEDPSLRIESSAIINLRGVSTKLNKYNLRCVNIEHSQKTFFCLSAH